MRLFTKMGTETPPSQQPPWTNHRKNIPKDTKIGMCALSFCRFGVLLEGSGCAPPNAPPGKQANVVHTLTGEEKLQCQLRSWAENGARGLQDGWQPSLKPPTTPPKEKLPVASSLSDLPLVCTGTQKFFADTRDTQKKKDGNF